MATGLKVGCGCASAGVILLSLVVGILLLGPFFFLLVGVTTFALWAFWRWLENELPAALGAARPVDQAASAGRTADRDRQSSVIRPSASGSSLEFRGPASRAGVLSRETFRRTRLLRFVYEDKRGNVTLREVKDWWDEGDRFTGYCLEMQAERTFLKSGVVEWLDGTEAFLDDQ